MSFTITITGKDGGHEMKWSKDIERTQALRLMAKLEGFPTVKQMKGPVTLLAPRKSAGKAHELQTALLALAGKEDISDYSLREIGRKVGGAHPQKIVHHLNQLVMKGLMSPERKPISQPCQ